MIKKIAYKQSYYSLSFKYDVSLVDNILFSVLFYLIFTYFLFQIAAY